MNNKYTTLYKRSTKYIQNIEHHMTKYIQHIRTWRIGAGPGGAASKPLGILYIVAYRGCIWIYSDTCCVYILYISAICVGVFVCIVLVYVWSTVLHVS